jgi:uncharacterized protein YigA (DUF484 family)
MSAALRQLQHRAEDLAECLLIFELELKRARNLEKRMAAFHDFARVLDRIDVLRRDAEEFLLSPRAKDAMLARLDRKAASVMRAPAYKVAEWFDSQGDHLSWLVGPASVDPIRQGHPN